jgi:hypothetical protein
MSNGDGLQIRMGDPADMISKMAPSGGGSGGGGIMGFLGGASSFLGAAAGPLGVVSGVVGFFSGLRQRRKAKRARRRQKRRARKSENLLVGAAESVVKDYATSQEYQYRQENIAQKQAVDQYQTGMENIESKVAATGIQTGAGAKALDDIKSQMARGQAEFQLASDVTKYTSNRQKESELRDIQGNLIELSAYSGRNINILDKYDIT